MARGLFNADGRLIGYQPGDVVTMVFGIDPAHGPDHSAVTVFEKQPDGSLTMVASETQAELRPLFQHADKPMHWVQGSDASTGDRYLCRPGVVTYLCFSDDRLVTWEFAPPLPGSMAEAVEVVNGARSV